MNKKYIASIVSLVTLVSLNTSAQESEYRYDDALLLWQQTGNAAGLGLEYSRDRGYAEFNVEHRSGDYRRVQEGGQRNQLKFATERYQRISMLFVGYGRFLFNMDRTKDRAWCDVMRPYNSNPFFSGSSISGKYDTQDFDLTATVSTIPIPLSGDKMDKEITVGVKLDYKVGDLSRLRDPRSRSELLDYKITPAVTYAFGKHTLGLNGHYNRRKEKIPGLITVQEDPNLSYYLMSGMEQASGTIGGYKGYSREWVNHEFGAELNYGYQADGLNSLTSVGISRGAEDAWGQYKYEPGKYTTYIYKVMSYNRIKAGALLHQLDLNMNFTQGYADEYRQQLIQEKEGEKGYTSYHYETQIEFKKRYQVKTTDASFHYRCSWLDNAAINGYAGLRYSIQNVSNKHLLPLSDFQYDHFNLQLEGGKAFFNKRLWVDLSGTYHFAKNVELNLADPTSDYAQQVWLPDQAYYNANYWQGHAEVKYAFPLTIKKQPTQWYAKAYGDFLKTNNQMDRKTIGIAIGIYN